MAPCLEPVAQVLYALTLVWEKVWPDLCSQVPVRVPVAYETATAGEDNCGLAVLQLQICSSLLSPVVGSV